MRARWVLIVVSGILLQAVNAGAQGDDPRLVRPTPDDYIWAWAYIAPQNRSGEAIQAMLAEMRYRYPDEFEYPDWATIDQWFFEQYLARFYPTSFDDLYQQYLSINRRWEINADREIWNRELILRWLTEQAVDLDSVDSLEFEDYAITITPRDFNVDGQHEWQLYVESPLFRGYLVLMQSPGGFRWVDVPLRWASDDAPFYVTQQSGIFEEMGFQDVNADGLPEWIVAYGGYGVVPGAYLVQGVLTIMQWREDRLVGIGGPEYTEGAGGGVSAVPFDTAWEFVNLDDDPALEFQGQPDCRVSVDCEGRQTVVFDWDGEYYRQVTPALPAALTNTPTPQPEPLPTRKPSPSERAVQIRYELPFRLRNDDLDVMLADVETALAAYEGSDQNVTMGLQYWRAFLLEELGHEAEATEAYYNLWQIYWYGYPWSALAGLHLTGIGAG